MKPALTLKEQLLLLKSRNLIFRNEVEAEQLLFEHNYYRLSGYWRNYQIDPKNGNNDFKAGTTFEKIIEVYNLDSKLRMLLNKGLEIFEVCFRSKFAYYIANSEENGAFAYLNANFYNNKISRNEMQGDIIVAINEEIKRSKELCITHYKKRGLSVPVWAAVEVLSFGKISKMYSRLKNREIVKNIYREFNVFWLFDGYKNVFPILQALVLLRNLCAHQARIWNKKVVASISDYQCLKEFGTSSERAHWRVITVLMLLVDSIKNNNEYSKELLDLCKSNEEFYQGLTMPNL